MNGTFTSTTPAEPLTAEKIIDLYRSIPRTTLCSWWLAPADTLWKIENGPETIFIANQDVWPRLKRNGFGVPLFGMSWPPIRDLDTDDNERNRISALLLSRMGTAT